MARAPAARPRVIQDPRLEADSTLFPYEWPALNELEETLSGLRPILEAAEVERLAEALPEVEARVDTLLAGSLPVLLTARGEEMKGRMIALQSAVRRVAELAPSALAAPSRPFVDVMDFAEDTSAAGEARPGVSDVPPHDSILPLAGAPAETPTPLEIPGDSVATVAQDTTAHAEPDDPAAATDPVEVYLDAWRDVFLQAEAILHRVRKPERQE